MGFGVCAFAMFDDAKWGIAVVVISEQFQPLIRFEGGAPAFWFFHAAPARESGLEGGADGWVELVFDDVADPVAPDIGAAFGIDDDGDVEVLRMIGVGPTVAEVRAGVGPVDIEPLVVVGRRKRESGDARRSLRAGSDRHDRSLWVRARGAGVFVLCGRSRVRHAR